MLLRGNSLPAGSQGGMTYNFEYLLQYFCFSKYGMSILWWCCLHLSCKLNLDLIYTVFQNIRYSSKNLNVLNADFSNRKCCALRWDGQDLFDQLMCFLCIMFQQLTYTELSGNISIIASDQREFRVPNRDADIQNCMPSVHALILHW
jgi:hypothetical protein